MMRENLLLARQAEFSGLAGLTRFIVTSVAGDYVICNTWDGTTAGTQDIAVAKPPLLRTSPTNRDDLDFEYPDDQSRTATDADANTESQEVCPKYLADDEIFALLKPQGLTGVTDADGKEVRWIDLNLDGRIWVKSP